MPAGPRVLFPPFHAGSLLRLCTAHPCAAREVVEWVLAPPAVDVQDIGRGEGGADVGVYLRAGSAPVRDHDYLRGLENSLLTLREVICDMGNDEQEIIVFEISQCN